MKSTEVAVNENAPFVNRPSSDEYWNAMLGMFNGGPRLTGSAAHNEFLNTVEGTLTSLGFDVQRDEMTFPRWDVTNYSLLVHDGTASGTPIEVAYPFVRSGLTPNEGLTLHLGSAADLTPHIAITSAPMTELGPVGCDLKSIALEPMAKAAISCISNQPNEQAIGTYQPFTPGLMKPALPTLMLGQESCEKITHARSKKQKVTLTLAGEIYDTATTAHVWGLLQGQVPTNLRFPMIDCAVKFLHKLFPLKYRPMT